MTGLAIEDILNQVLEAAERLKHESDIEQEYEQEMNDTVRDPIERLDNLMEGILCNLETNPEKLGTEDLVKLHMYKMNIQMERDQANQE